MHGPSNTAAVTHIAAAGMSFSHRVMGWLFYAPWGQTIPDRIISAAAGCQVVASPAVSSGYSCCGPSQSVALADSSVCVVRPVGHLVQLPVGSFGVPPGDQLPLSHGLGCFDFTSTSLQFEHMQMC
jgi:hypothetical protein